QHLRQTYKDNVPDFDQVFDEVSRTIIEQIEALGRIASEFSHFARMPKSQLEPCNVNAILTESINLFEQNSQIHFATTFEANIPTILADREELRRAFINIIRNGIQAMENRGEMRIGTMRKADGVQVTIRDHGPGIPEEIKGRLFEPNFSTKTDGMGLGLAIVKKTVEDLGGEVMIESAQNEGTTVVVFLPSQSKPSERA
ncbi:MAG: ATP-binding protein, partial [Ignavibacteriae bacterium]|nr:ATP-binding protein [Ignavibacteriota bacterium]